MINYHWNNMASLGANYQNQKFDSEMNRDVIPFLSFANDIFIVHRQLVELKSLDYLQMIEYKSDFDATYTMHIAHSSMFFNGSDE